LQSIKKLLALDAGLIGYELFSRLYFFKEDDRGNIKYAANVKLPNSVLIKTPWYGTPFFNYLLLGIAVIIFITMIFVGIIRFIRIRRRKVEVSKSGYGRLMSWTAFILSLLNLVFIMIFMMVFVQLSAAPYGVPGSLRTLLIIPWIITVLTLILLILIVRCWWKRLFSPGFRIYYSFVTAAPLAFAWFLYYWNLLGV